MDKMKILHTGTLDVNAGGPAMSTYYTLWGLQQQGVEAELLIYPLSEGGRLRGDQVKVHFAKAPWEHKLAFSPNLKKEIKAAGSFDIYHAQGIWQYPTYALADVAKKLGKPYVITPRGMLYPQDIANSSTKFKEVSLKLRLLKDLNQAACVQVTCDEEMLHCRNLGVTSPIAVIPNPIEIRDRRAYPQNSMHCNERCTLAGTRNVPLRLVGRLFSRRDHFSHRKSFEYFQGGVGYNGRKRKGVIRTKLHSRSRCHQNEKPIRMDFREK